MKGKKNIEPNYEKLEFTGERVVPKETPYPCFQEHINRYHFTSRFIKNKVVLDVACGTGYGSDYLIKKGAKKLVGLDISQEAINYAKNNYKNPNLTFIVGEATKLPFKNEYFDVIVSFETIEHIKEYKKFLDECKRVLKNGGIFICSTPNKRFTSIFLKNMINPFHITEFYPEEFQNLIQEYFPYTKIYGQNNINMIKKYCMIIIEKLVSAIPQNHHIKDKFRDLNSNKNHEEDNKSINEHYKVTNFRDTKLTISEFLIIVAKEIN